MRAIINSFHRWENKAERMTARLASSHPVLGYAALIVLLPVTIMGVLMAASAVTIFPMAWFMGWL